MDARRLCTDYIKPSIVNRCGRPRLAGCCGSNAGSGSNAGIGGTAVDDGSSGAGQAAAALQCGGLGSGSGDRCWSSSMRGRGGRSGCAAGGVLAGLAVASVLAPLPT